jgi:hypothetical protein
MSGSLIWGVKSSLLNYVASLDDGKVEVVAPAQANGKAFSFPIQDSQTEFDPASGNGILQFQGGLNITGYFGALRIAINEPQLRITNGVAELAIKFEGYKGKTSFDVIAQGSYDSNTNSCDLNLTYTGQMLLGQQYQVGQPIDSATVQFG